MTKRPLSPPRCTVPLRAWGAGINLPNRTKVQLFSCCTWLTLHPPHYYRGDSAERVPWQIRGKGKERLLSLFQMRLHFIIVSLSLSLRVSSELINQFYSGVCRWRISLAGEPKSLATHAPHMLYYFI